MLVVAPNLPNLRQVIDSPSSWRWVTIGGRCAAGPGHWGRPVHREQLVVACERAAIC